MTVYYDHWAANRLDVELFWGPELSRIFIEEREPSASSWLDDIWAEGGCVVDFDKKHLLWYGGEDILYTPDLNLITHDLMEGQWSGWTVEWAKDGIFDIARKASVSIDVVSSGKLREAKSLAQPNIYESGSDKFFYANNVISIVEQGDLSWAILSGDVECLANVDLTPSLIIKLVQDFSENDFEHGKSIDPSWGNYTWGAHFDFDTLSLEYWNPNPSEGLYMLTNQRFPQWSVIDHGPEYLWHKALVPAKDWPGISRQKKLDVLDAYRRTLASKRTNPVVSVLTAMTNGGERNIKINTKTLEHRKGDQELLQTKHNILDMLEMKIKRQT